MKIRYLFFIFFVLIGLPIKAQLIAVGSTGGTGSPVSFYPSLAAAISAINDGVTHTGTITCNVSAGYTEIAPPGGYVITATGTATNPITIKKAGSGSNPILYASPSQPVGSLHDAVIEIIGGDYITIDGFDIQEHPSNSITTASNNNMTEWGIALNYASPTDGCQYVTIKNCTITMKRFYQNSFGIYANSTHNSTVVNTVASATGPTGGNNFLTIQSNTIQDVNHPIVIVGPTGGTDFQSHITIGGNVSEGNIISNFGTTGTFSNFMNVPSGNISGIVVRNTKNFIIKNNQITSSTNVSSGMLNGILVPPATSSITGTYTNEISNNTINLQSGVTSGAMYGIQYANNSASTASSVVIQSNTFQNFNHTVTSFALISFINCVNPSLHTTISNNIFNTISVSTSGSVEFINCNFSAPSGGSKTISNNSIDGGFYKNTAGGYVTFYYDYSSSPANTTHTISGNQITNVYLVGNTSFVGIQEMNGGAPFKNIVGNVIQFIDNNSSTGSAFFRGIHTDNDGGMTIINGNIISNVNFGNSTGSVVGIMCGSYGTGGAKTTDINGNLIHSLTCQGSGAVNGIQVAHSNGMKRNVFKNKIYSLTSFSSSTFQGLVNGILFNGTDANLTAKLYNNVIGFLNAPSSESTDAVRGISLNLDAFTSTISVYHNTILLSASSSGSNFGTSGIFHRSNFTSTTTNLNLQNNLIINLSQPTGSGRTVAFRRSSSSLSNLGTVNNNIYYAGTPSPSNLLYSDGANNFSSMSAYQSFISPLETNSKTEDTSQYFISTMPSDTDFCKLNDGYTTEAESGGVPIPGITDDYWGTPRPYPSPTFGGTAVDIGACEFDGIPVNLSISELELPSHISVHPNPVNEKLFVVSNEQIKYAIVFNMNGQLIMHKEIHNDQLDMSSLSSGQYVVQFALENGKIFAVKVVKK